MNEQNYKVWLLGARDSNADKNITWDQTSWPNLSDPDIIILDLTTLDKNTYQRMTRQNLVRIRNEIFNKFINKGTIIFIVGKRSASDGNPTLDLSPIIFDINKVNEGTNIIIPDKNNRFFAYLTNVKKFSYYFNNIDFHFSSSTVEPSNEDSKMVLDLLGKWKYEVDQRMIEVENPVRLSIEPLAVDNSNAIISFACTLKTNGIWQSGTAIILPITTEVSVNESIDLILSAFGKTTFKEHFPDWVYGIKLSDVDDISKKIIDLEGEKKKVQDKINSAIRHKETLENHYRLLTSKGVSLENAVYEGFKILGFDEIKKIRSTDKEDWVIEFKTYSDYKYGIIEVKGAETRTDLKHLRQCDNWIEDYHENNTRVKGIFISNQYRQEKYPNTKSNRFRFEPNEISFANRNDICIIPSCILFDRVIKEISSEHKDRSRIEELIANTKGILFEL